MPTPRWSLAVLLLLLGHFAWGLGRAVLRGAPRRHADVAAYRSAGDAAFLFADAKLPDAEASAAVIRWLREHTPRDARIRWQGQDRGVVEFAAALLWPRLLVTGPGSDPDGPVLVATGTTLTLRER